MEAILECGEDAPGRVEAKDVTHFMNGIQKCLSDAPVSETPSWASNNTSHEHDHRVWLTRTAEEAKVKPAKWLRTSFTRYPYDKPHVSMGCVDNKGMYWNIMFHRTYPSGEGITEKAGGKEKSQYTEFQRSISDMWMKSL